MKFAHSVLAIMIALWVGSAIAAEPIVVTIHANTDETTQVPTFLRGMQAIPFPTEFTHLKEYLGEAESISRGHAWVSVRRGSECTTYGLFGSGPTRNEERGYKPGLIRQTQISELQYQKLLEAIYTRAEYRWTGYYNCASYASDLWLAATGESLNPVPVGTVWIDKSGKRQEIRQNVRLNPLPPAPLGLVQEIIARANGRSLESSTSTVCPQN